MTIEDASLQKNNADASAARPSAGIHTDPVDAFKCAECGEMIDVKGRPAFSEVVCPKCATQASVPARLSNFLLLKLMGTGGMGGVYYARDEQLGRFVAIKVMLQSLGEDPAFIETFRREAQAVAKLNHPNIAQIYSFGQEKGQPYIVMELVSGERVDAMMESGGGISPFLAMRIGLEIAQGLSAADEAGLVHGDIKPENILLDTKGKAKLVDFGLATVAHQAAGEGIWGTPYYIAPEKIRRQKVDARSDIYSLGATLYHMLTGKPPFEGATPVAVVKARLEVPPPDPRKICPQLPEIVSTIIIRMLAVERTERYPNYLSLISDLRKAVHELGNAPAKTGRFPGSSKQIRFKKRPGSSGAEEPSSAGNATPAANSKKLIIRKESSSTAPVKTTKAPIAGMTRHTTIITSSQTREIPKPPISPQEVKAKAERERRQRKKTAIVVSILLALLALAGIVVLGHMRGQEEIKQRADLFALNNARTEATAMFASISNNTDRINGYFRRAELLAVEIQAAVELITGRQLVIEPPKEPEPAAPEVTTNAVDAAGTATNAAPEVTPAAEPAAPTAVEPAAEPAVAVMKPGAATEGNPDAPAAAGTDVAAPVAEAVPPAEPEVPAHPVEAPAREALVSIQTLGVLSSKTGGIVVEAEALTSRINKCMTSAAAQPDSTALRGINEQMLGMVNETTNLFTTANVNSAKVIGIRQQFAKDAADRQAAEKEAQRLREEAERAERERQELSARTATEIQQAQNDRAEVKGMFDANNFEEALGTLKQRIENYRTPEGKAAFQTVVNRYEYLAAMKAGLTTAMQETPYAWGWGVGSSARDITSADGKGIYVRGVAKPYPWSDVQIAQMLKLVDYYLADRNIKARTRIDIAFGTAIYCDEFGPKARERAKHYADRAIDMGLSRDTFARLLEASWQ